MQDDAADRLEAKATALGITTGDLVRRLLYGDPPKVIGVIYEQVEAKQPEPDTPEKAGARKTFDNDVSLRREFGSDFESYWAWRQWRKRHGT